MNKKKYLMDQFFAACTGNDRIDTGYRLSGNRMHKLKVRIVAQGISRALAAKDGDQGGVGHD